MHGDVGERSLNMQAFALVGEQKVAAEGIRGFLRSPRMPSQSWGYRGGMLRGERCTSGEEEGGQVARGAVLESIISCSAGHSCSVKDLSKDAAKRKGAFSC